MKNLNLKLILKWIKNTLLKIMVIFIKIDKEFTLTENMITKIEEIKKNV
jgi:hypothetical protein